MIFKKIIQFYLLSMIFHTISYSQQLVTYPLYNNTNEVIPDNSVSTVPTIGICGDIANSDYKIGHNNDFTVRVKKDNDNDWKDLFEYNTFVNSSTGDLSGVSKSSFVSFDYSGTVNIEITCNNFSSISGKVLIRPLSRNITQSISGNVLTLTLTSPPEFDAWNGKSYSDKLSIELNGNRYRNLHIFANKIHNYTTPTGPAVVVFEKVNNGTSNNIYNKSLWDGVSKKIIIKEGAIVIVPYSPYFESNYSTILMQSNDEIYIEGGGVLKGGINAHDVENIKIYGRGIIDLTNLPKQYTKNQNSYGYNQGITIRRCKNVFIDGLTINDPQQVCVELKDCGGSTSDPIENITINNLKMFSRVIWGDGIHMKGTSNVAINDCFARTSDDGIAIYASRIDGYSVSQNRDALNIRVTNTKLYPDNAHAIVIGWHGNQSSTNDGNNIYNLNFDNIDILEHDQNWVDPDGFIHSEYDGAIGIVCSDANKCDSFTFSNIRVEDFTNGSLLTVRVMRSEFGGAQTNGQYVRNIHFQNFTYNGSGEHKSVIQGIGCDNYVDGVHFQNFKINNQLITKLSDYVLPLGQLTSYPIVKPPLYNTSGFDTNQYAYNITFEEANNYSTALLDGYYTIQNIGSSTNFLKNIISQNYVTSNNNFNDERIWYIEKVTGSGNYRIKPYIDETKTLQSLYTRTQPDTACDGRYITLEDNNPTLTNQEWKIVPVTTGSNTYKINNAYTRGYLTYSNSTNLSNSVLLSKNSTTFQNWKITPTPISFREMSDINTSSNQDLNVIKIFPNPTNDFLNINNLKNSNDSILKIVDLKGSIILSEQINSENSKIYIGNISNGIYLLLIEKNKVLIYSKKIIKN